MDRAAAREASAHFGRGPKAEMEADGPAGATP